MDIRDLKIFHDIAQEKSFVKAAHLNYLTQPSVSLRLKQLEEKLGVKLLDRAPRRVLLTREGELLLPRVEELLEQFENLKSFVAKLKNVKKGNVRVATIHSVGIYELTPILKKFIRTYPDVQIHLQYRPAQVIYDLVVRKEIDLGLVAYPQFRSKIEITPFAKDTMVLIVPPDHRLAKRKSVPLKNIRGEKFIAFDQSAPTREAIDEVLAKKGITVAIQSVNENVDTLKRAVEVGLGISIVPSKTVSEEIQKGSIRALKIRDGCFERPLGILTLKGRILSEAAALFIHTLTENSAPRTRPAAGKS